MDQEMIRYKMILFGNVSVGKTSLVNRYVNNKFVSNYISTLGYNVYEKQIPHDNVILSIMIYDVGGQEQFRDLRRKYAEGANTAFIIYDVTNRESFEKIPDWKHNLFLFSGEIPFILIGNKIDLEDDRKVSFKEGMELSVKLGALAFVETSAKNGIDVEKAFVDLSINTYKSYNE